MSAVIWPSLIFAEAGPHPDGIYDHPMSLYGAAWMPGDTLQPGYVTGDGAVDENPQVIKMVQRSSINDTFYNRILIEPPILQMGNLLSNQNRTVTIWNGFLDNKLLQDFSTTNADGITIVEPVTTPYMMRGLEQLAYNVNITTDGPAVIDASLIWTVAGAPYVAKVTGRRVVIWPYGPSWDTPVVETLSWLTNILRSYDGTEQRRGMRFIARRKFAYTFKTVREESARLENLLWGWQNRTYALPVWTDKSRLTSAVSQGATVIALPTTTFSFSAGALAIIYGDSRKAEVVEIQSVGANSLALVRPLENNWPRGTRVMPVILGHLPTRVAVMRHTSQAITGSLIFESDPRVTYAYIPTSTPAVTYKGVEVLMRQPNWKGGLSNEFEYLFHTLDYQTGGVQWDTREDFPRIARAYTWLLNGRHQIAEFRAMLGRRVGMLKPIWVPTWHDDFIVTRTIGASDSAIFVKENDFRLMVGTDPARNQIMIRLNDGTNFFREIVGVSSDGADTSLILDAPLGREVLYGQVKTVHLVMRSRLAGDEINISWRTDRAATIDTAFMTIKE